MTRYVAFLRPTQAGGHSGVGIEDLKRLAFSLGFGNFSGYKTGGNYVFDSELDDPAEIEEKLRRPIRMMAGTEVGVFVRPMERIVEISRMNPFRTISLGGADAYVAFLSAAPAETALPAESPRKDVRIVQVDGREAFYLAKKVKGKADYPNEFVEETLKASATSRSWEIVWGIADLK